MERIEEIRNQNYEISGVETERQVKKLKNMKAIGPNGIPNEFYKEGGEKVQKGLYRLVKEIVKEEEVPMTWNEVRVTLLHKGMVKVNKR